MEHFQAVKAEGDDDDNSPSTSQPLSDDVSNPPVDATSSSQRQNTTPNYDDSKNITNNVYNISGCKGVKIKTEEAAKSLSRPAKSLNTSAEEDEESPNTSTEEDEESKITEAVNKIRQVQLDKCRVDLLLRGLSKKEIEEIPEVHPRIVNVQEGDEFLKEDTYKPIVGQDESFYDKEESFSYGKEISFNDLLQSTKENTFITLIGFPGSGKTTLAKRLAKSFCTKTNGLCFYLEFSNMNYPDNYTLTLKDFLLDKAYPDFEKQVYKYAFKWVLKNQEKCLIILDGYDRAEWSLDKVGDPPNMGHNDPQTIQYLVANLCRNHFLRNACVFLTSRPHKTTFIPRALRPSLSLMLLDLSVNSTKTLFFALAQENAKKYWGNLVSTPSYFMGFYLNPLILQLYIRACGNPKTNVSQICTLTRIYSTVVLEMRGNTRHSNINDIVDQLSRLAFSAIRKCKITVTREEFLAAQLDIEETKDLLIAADRSPSAKFQKTTRFYFLHQSLLEYFAAYHIVHEMNLSDYKDFLKWYLFTDQWAMVRRFLCGLLLDDKGFPPPSVLKDAQEKSKPEEILTEKSRYFQDSLCHHIELSGQRKLALLCNDIWECRYDKLTSRAVATFPNRVLFHNIPISSNDAHAIGYVLRQVNQNLKELKLKSSCLDSFSFGHLYEAVKDMKVSIAELDVRYNRLSPEDNDKICDILHKITDVLLMRECFAEGEERRSANNEERNKLRDSLNKLPNSKLIIVVASESERTVMIKHKSVESL